MPLGLPRQVKAVIQPGLLGKAVGAPPGIGPPSPPRKSILPPGKATLPHPPIRPPQGSSNEEPNPK